MTIPLVILALGLHKKNPVQFLARTSLSPQGPVSPPFATNIRRIETAVAHHPVQMAAVLLSWQCAAAQRLA